MAGNAGAVGSGAAETGAWGLGIKILLLMALILSLLMLLLLLITLLTPKDLMKKNELPVKPPGSRLLGITDFLYSQKDNDRLFIPIIRDMRDEWLEAYAQKRFIKAQWIKIRYSYAFCQAMGINVGVSLAKKIFDAWRVGD